MIKVEIMRRMPTINKAINHTVMETAPWYNEAVNHYVLFKQRTINRPVISEQCHFPNGIPAEMVVSLINCTDLSVQKEV